MMHIDPMKLGPENMDLLEERPYCERCICRSNRPEFHFDGAKAWIRCANCGRTGPSIECGAAGFGAAFQAVGDQAVGAWNALMNPARGES